MNILYIVIIIFVLLVLYVIFAFNSLVAARNRKENAWSDIDVQMKRRYDLIPNLIETVKGFAKQEKSVFEEVTKARSQAMQAGSLQEHAQAENMLTGALKSLFAVSEAYPDLKSNQNFLHLQQELVDTEDKIQAARRFFNSAVQDLNDKIQMFPGNIIATIFSFKEEEFFTLEEQGARQPVKVSF
ncbi:MAG: LemA family protein [Alphaproteobacteria bacterium]|nr:LemA family protein [Alphaproteobacteria bacterium]